MMKHEKIIESMQGLNLSLDRLEDTVSAFFCRPPAERCVPGDAKAITLDEFLTDTPEKIARAQNRIIAVIEDLQALTTAPDAVNKGKLQ
jgi:hypothetical protein